jgi:hypothetical protein
MKNAGRRRRKFDAIHATRLELVRRLAQTHHPGPARLPWLVTCCRSSSAWELLPLPRGTTSSRCPSWAAKTLTDAQMNQLRKVKPIIRGFVSSKAAQDYRAVTRLR